MTSTSSISSSVKKLELSTGFPAHHALFPWSSLCLVPKTLREYGKVSSITQGIKGKDTSSLFPRYLTLIENSFPSTTCLNTMSGWRREKHPGVEFLCDFHVPLSPPSLNSYPLPHPSLRERKTRNTSRNTDTRTCLQPTKVQSFFLKYHKLRYTSNRY